MSICEACIKSCKDKDKKDCKEFELATYVRCKKEEDRVHIKICLISNRHGCGICKLGKLIRGLK
jgi:hypothetical protein